MLPLVEVALDFGWKVEIWSYKDSLCSKFQTMARKCDLFSIHPIDDIFGRVTFQNYTWTLSLRYVPRDRSMICMYVSIYFIVISLLFDGTCFYNNCRFDKKKVQDVEPVVDKAMEIFHLPFLGAKIKLQDNISTIDLLLVPSCPQRKNSEEKFYDFTTLFRNKRQEFMNAVPCELITYHEYKNRSVDHDIPDTDDETIDKNNIGMFFSLITVYNFRTRIKSIYYLQILNFTMKTIMTSC